MAELVIPLEASIQVAEIAHRTGIRYGDLSSAIRTLRLLPDAERERLFSQTETVSMRDQLIRSYRACRWSSAEQPSPAVYAGEKLHYQPNVEAALSTARHVVAYLEKVKEQEERKQQSNGEK